ncbi:uncharacterized protein si:dkey-68o6.6 [Periophthalmus magnuspinnatus]|uniref:uncharacterized protein si:dkey-68o6.6 n=1 Tax=Periophthalmus magnuspinnatus TaxID=409849 RepID=UPI00145A34DA|nr:uncharacterized protein si:dkey-68o6.6 [Periophthalmus magnuspinnatus]
MPEEIMRMRKRVPSTGRENGRGESKRWASPRKRQRTDYTSMDWNEDSESNSEEDEETSEEVLPSWPYWDVTCGTKKGILHVQYLERGQKDCIMSGGRWFSPSGFEEFGGKRSHKKWKNSIIYKSQPLNFWIDRGYLKPQIKRHTFTASERSKHKESHCEESDDKRDHEEEVGSDEAPSEEQTDVLNGEKTNDTESTVSKRKPLLILPRLEGVVHLLLNDVVLSPNGSRCTATEKQSDDETVNSSDDDDDDDDDAPGPETSSRCSGTEHEQHEEVEDTHIENTVMSKDQGVGTSPQEVKIENNINSKEEIIKSMPRNVISQDSTQLSERTPQEDNPRTVSDEPGAKPQTSTEVNVLDLQQLKREKIKWQIKVLKLQEEYYSLQIQKLKQ